MNIGKLMELENSDNAVAKHSSKSFSEFSHRERVALAKGQLIRGNNLVTYWIDYEESNQEKYKNVFWDN